jgi:drug/metabolite transporter (DMT)-like permease
MRIAFFLGLIVFAGTGGEMFVSRAMKRIGEVRDFSPRSLLRVIGRAFSSATMWTGILLMTISFFALLALLSWRNVSFVVPATALNYALGALGGRYLLGERVSTMRWLGVALVCLGVVFVVIG